jgi:hypothetical protein
VLLAGATLVAASAIGGSAAPRAARAQIASIPSIPPSPGWTRALPPGPDSRTKMTDAYVRLVARDAYFWA